MNVPQSKRMKPKTVEKLIQEASDDDRLRWKWAVSVAASQTQ
jgi:hypothetical protein